jgi:hypothetical protein
VLSEIDNFALKLSNKAKQVRFSPAVLRLAMNLYNKSPTAYQEFKEQYIFSLPSESTLLKVRGANKVEEGFNPIIYCRYQERREEARAGDQRDGANGEDGHIGCDEMHLKAGIWWNTSNHDILGFEGDCKNFDDEVTTLISDMKRPPKKLAVSVNQFKYRSTFGKTQNLDFFYNSGSLSGKDIAKQVFHVIKSLEAIDCRVHGFASDAGGNNAKLYALLRGHLTEEGLWEDPDLVSFLNPVDPTRRVWLWHCTTHLLKAFRNQL